MSNILGMRLVEHNNSSIFSLLRSHIKKLACFAPIHQSFQWNENSWKQNKASQIDD